MLFRTGIRDEFRKEALAGLATSSKKSEIKVLLDAISEHDSKENTESAVAPQLMTNADRQQLTAPMPFESVVEPAERILSWTRQRVMAPWRRAT